MEMDPNWKLFKWESDARTKPFQVEKNTMTVSKSFVFLIFLFTDYFYIVSTFLNLI